MDISYILFCSLQDISVYFKSFIWQSMKAEFQCSVLNTIVPLNIMCMSFLTHTIEKETSLISESVFSDDLHHQGSSSGRRVLTFLCPNIPSLLVQLLFLYYTLFTQTVHLESSERFVTALLIGCAHSHVLWLSLTCVVML